MQDMRYLNLFWRVTNIKTIHCIKYNETIFFCVSKPLVKKAVGENASNVRKLSEIIGKRIKIIPHPRGIQEIELFVHNLISPGNFKSIEIKGEEAIITAGGTQNKAMLIGRDKRRLLEMQRIIKDFFGKELRIAWIILLKILFYSKLSRA